MILLLFEYGILPDHNILSHVITTTYFTIFITLSLIRRFIPTTVYPSYVTFPLMAPVTPFTDMD